MQTLEKLSMFSTKSFPCIDPYFNIIVSAVIKMLGFGIVILELRYYTPKFARAPKPKSWKHSRRDFEEWNMNIASIQSITYSVTTLTTFTEICEASWFFLNTWASSWSLEKIPRSLFQCFQLRWTRKIFDIVHIYKAPLLNQAGIYNKACLL